MEPSTVKEIIEKLQQLPPDLPCYVRPKYYGNVEWWQDVPVNINGISQMERTVWTNDENVTFLV